MNLRRCLSITCLLIAAGTGLARAETVLRSALEPETAWVGQRVLLKIDVLSDAGWAQISHFGELKITGAYVMRSGSQGVRLQETIEGQSFSGQRYEFAIYPQVAGTMQLPAIPVAISVRRYAAESTQGSMAGGSEQAITPAATLEVRTPPGAEGMVGLISTSSLIVEQHWESVSDQPKVGDALKRTITFKASDVSGMAFKPLSFDAIPTVGTYPSEPTVQDTSDRGSLTGTRIESVSYVLERAGAVSFPEIRISWWNTKTERLEQLSLAGMELEVSAGVIAARPTAARASGVTVLTALAGTILLGLLALAVHRFRPGLLAWWHARKLEQQQSETGYFKRVITSIESGDPKRAAADLMRWLDRIHDGTTPARLDEFLDQYAQPQEHARLSALLNSVNHDSPLSDPKRLTSDLRQLRGRWRAKRKSTAQATVIRLPALN